MDLKTQVLRFKARRLKERMVTKALLLYARFSLSIPERNPDFIGIGPARSATGWIHKRLSLHPDIFLPSIKEVHFFDRKSKNTSTYFFDLSNPIHWRWYQYYFKNSHNKVKGEITPAYSVLDEERINEISSHLPNIKLIYSIRNPIDRAWSSLRFRLWHGKGLVASKLSVDELKVIVQAPEIITKSNHKHNILKWERYFPEDNLHYVFCDDIKQEPRNVLVNICNFLNVDPNRLPDESIDNRRINTVPYCEPPGEIVNYLKDMFYDQIVFLEEKFRRDLKAWYC